MLQKEYNIGSIYVWVCNIPAQMQKILIGIA